MWITYIDGAGEAHEAEASRVKVTGTGGHAFLHDVEHVDVVDARWVRVRRSRDVNVDSCSDVATSASVIDDHLGIVVPHGTRIQVKDTLGGD